MKAAAQDFTAEFCAYFTSRILRLKIALLWALLLGASVLVSASVSASASAAAPIWQRALLCALLILAFRLWDDLADREYDASHHPERVLPRSRNLRPFWQVLLLLQCLLLALLLYWGSVLQIGLYLALNAILAVLYFNRLAHLRRLRSQCVLLKYPVFLYLTGQAPLNDLAPLCALGLYLVLSFEDWRFS